MLVPILVIGACIFGAVFCGAIIYCSTGGRGDDGF